MTFILRALCFLLGHREYRLNGTRCLRCGCSYNHFDGTWGR